MNGPLAQIVALTCHGNASLDGKTVPTFFPTNSTCRFCDRIRFTKTIKPFLRKPRETVAANSPDEWIAGLHGRIAGGIRLAHTSGDDPRITDRMSAGFVGGGGHWMMELVLPGGKSEFWSAQWDVGDKEAPERRIWQVTYRRVGEYRTRPYRGRELSAVRQDFQASLKSIHAFSVREQCDPFTKLFADALLALEDPEADIGEYKDLSVPRQLLPEALALLKAAMSAWVFGAMGSWNDLVFEGAKHEEYEMVSESLFAVLNEAIEVAACSSRPQGAPG